MSYTNEKWFEPGGWVRVKREYTCTQCCGYGAICYVCGGTGKEYRSPRPYKEDRLAARIAYI